MSERKKEIYDVASNYLANRMKTRMETETHLQKKGFCQKEIDAVLGSFEELGYLNDVEYVSIFISHGIRKGKTLWKIKKELEQKGVGKPDLEAGIQRHIDENQANPEEDEFERGVAIVTKIVDNAGFVDKKVLAKAGRKLVSLGYKSETVYRILGQFMQNIEV